MWLVPRNARAVCGVPTVPEAVPQLDRERQGENRQDRFRKPELRSLTDEGDSLGAVAPRTEVEPAYRSFTRSVAIQKASTRLAPARALAAHSPRGSRCTQEQFPRAIEEAETVARFREGSSEIRRAGCGNSRGPDHSISFETVRVHEREGCHRGRARMLARLLGRYAVQATPGTVANVARAEIPVACTADSRRLELTSRRAAVAARGVPVVALFAHLDDAVAARSCRERTDCREDQHQRAHPRHDPSSDSLH
jgi:hypothetical protein